MDYVTNEGFPNLPSWIILKIKSIIYLPIIIINSFKKKILNLLIVTI